jgi:hypothetical protein
MERNFSRSHKAFYSSSFGGILPCEIIRIGRKKIYIRIGGYDINIWVTPAKLLLKAKWQVANLQ